ncbi:MAG: hypothetical protein ACD_21C00274G0002 [uncultured bacterium]|nr:MAG: hypothetical protein ACD_21C00274G0002 [uncultured bacterium]
MKPSPKHCTGFTLLEVLLASALGLALIGVVLQNYLSSKNIYNAQTAIARLTENIRFANFFLEQNIMHAGFAGCRRISELDLTNHADIGFGALEAIHGYDSAQAPLYLKKKKIAPGTDVIIITKANSGITNVTADVKAGATSMKVEQNPVTQASNLLLISDCSSADLFIAKNWADKTIVTESELHHSYQASSAQVSQFEELSFFISSTARDTAKRGPVYSLYFSVNRGRKQELVPEISDMQIVYGVDAQGQGMVTKYLKANEITSWNKVLSVVITLKPQNQLLALNQWKIYIKLRERD